MSERQEALTLCCDECGQDKVITPSELTDESQLTCDSCGAEYGMLGAVKRVELEKVKEQLASAFGKAFDGLEGVKFTKA